MSRNPRIRDLSATRSLLKCARHFRGPIPLQLEIIDLLHEEDASASALASAHNLASVLYLRANLYSSAEWHGRQALALHSDDSVKGHEALGAYYLVMAQILACRFEFDAAVGFGRKAIEAYCRWHSPPDEFLARVINEVDAMRNHTWAAPE